MTNLGDALNDAFASDAERTHSLDASRAIGAIRRRRAIRAAGAGTAAAVGIGAVGAVAWAVPGGRFASPSQSETAGICSAEQLYLPPNPDAMGDAEILFRSYVNPDSEQPAIVAAVGGKITAVAPNAQGEYIYEGEYVYTEAMGEMLDRPLVSDHTHGASSGDDWDGRTPYVWDYSWTTFVPEEVPEGVNTELLSMTLSIATGLGGLGYIESSVPDGAVTEFLVTTTTTVTGFPLQEGDPVTGADELAKMSGLKSVALRVSNLPDGGTFTITSKYEDPDPALTACAGPSTMPMPSNTSSPEASAEVPDEPMPGASEVPAPEASALSSALTGPESVVFACGAPLPQQNEGTLGLNVTWGDGSAPHPVDSTQSLDLGSGSVVIQGNLDNISGVEVPALPGWSASGTASADSVVGVGVYSWLAAVSDEQIVGTLAEDPRDLYGRGPQDMSGAASNGDGTTLVYQTIFEPQDRIEPCEGFAQSDVEGAQLVVLLGNAVDDGFEFAWAPVD